MNQFGPTINLSSLILIVACICVWYWTRNKAKSRKTSEVFESKVILKIPRKEFEKKIIKILATKGNFGGWQKKRKGKYITEFSAYPLTMGEGFGALAVIIVVSLLSAGWMFGIPVGVFLGFISVGLAVKKTEKLVLDYSSFESNEELMLSIERQNPKLLFDQIERLVKY